jgi:hypothetical protein
MTQMYRDIDRPETMVSKVLAIVNYHRDKETLGRPISQKCQIRPIYRNEQPRIGVCINVNSSSEEPKPEAVHYLPSAQVLTPILPMTNFNWRFVDPHELEEAARQKLSLNGWNYAASNGGSSFTDRANREAFYRHRIIPRMLRDTNQRDTTTELFGHKISAPIVFAPIGVNKIYHPDGELAPAKVAGELGLPYCLR